MNGKNPFALYDFVADPFEKNLAGDHPGEVRKLKAKLQAWRKSCKASAAGDDD